MLLWHCRILRKLALSIARTMVILFTRFIHIAVGVFVLNEILEGTVHFLIAIVKHVKGEFAREYANASVRAVGVGHVSLAVVGKVVVKL